MCNEFFYLLIETVVNSSKRIGDIDAKCISDDEFNIVYNKILDRITYNIFFDSIGDEVLLNAFVKLSRLEKIIVVFYIMLEYKAVDVANIANTSVDSVHTQRYKAVKRLRKALGIKK